MKKSTKEIIDYGIWGVATVVFNMVSYLFFKLYMSYQYANLVSIILTKTFAYFVNKKFVFHTKKGFLETIQEMFRFIFARAFTGLIDYLGLLLLVNVFRIQDNIGKVIMIIITTLMNYLLGKYKVFNQRKIRRVGKR